MASILRVDTLTDASSNNSTAMSTINQGTAKVWADIAAGGASLPDSFNCSSIDDDGTGEYGINIASDMGSASYSAQATITFNNSGSNNLRTATVESKAAGAVELDFAYTNSSAVAIAYDVETDASIVIHGDLA
tara:strand:+ start:329 stop:727 length:399 start_codon:yes stop_codon:yes gene_type:complete